MATKPIYRNCYIRPSAKNSKIDQELAISSSGAVSGVNAKLKVETGTKATPVLDALLGSVRAGEEFVVAELQCLGDNLPAVMAALKKIQAKKLIIVEAMSGRRFEGSYDGPAAGLAASDYFRNRSLSTMKAKRAGQAGAAKRYEDLHAGRVPLAEAVTRWNAAVRQGASMDEAMGAINEGYSDYLPYRTLRNMAVNGKLPKALLPLPAGRRPQT